MEKKDPPSPFDKNHHFDQVRFFNPEMETMQFLKGLSLMERSLQGFLSLDPPTASHALFTHREGISGFLDCAIITRDKINAMLSMISKEIGGDPEWVVYPPDQGFGGEADRVTQNLIRAMTLCRNKISSLTQNPEKSIPILKAKASPLEELGGRLWNLKKSLGKIFSIVQQNPIVPLESDAHLVKNAIDDSHRENLAARIVEKERTNLPTVRKSHKKRASAPPVPSAENKPETKQVGDVEALMENFVPKPPFLKLNPEFGPYYPWLEDETLYPIEKNKENEVRLSHFHRAIGSSKDDAVVAVRRGSHYRPLVIKRAALVDPSEMERLQKEKEAAELEATNWDLLDDIDTEDYAPHRKNRK
jgi:hypothetical protein